LCGRSSHTAQLKPCRCSCDEGCRVRPSLHVSYELSCQCMATHNTHSVPNMHESYRECLKGAALHQRALSMLAREPTMAARVWTLSRRRACAEVGVEARQALLRLRLGRQRVRRTARRAQLLRQPAGQPAGGGCVRPSYMHKRGGRRS